MVFIASTTSSVSPIFTWEPTSTNWLAAGLRRDIGGADHGRDHHTRMFSGSSGAKLLRAAGVGAAAARGAAATEAGAAGITRDAHALAVLLDFDFG